MKQLFFAALLVMACQMMAGAQRVRNIVGFEENSSELSAEARSELDQFRSFNSGYIVEKVDIVAHCSPGEQTFHSLKLSRERSRSVYQYLSGILPDEGNYELRYFDSAILGHEDAPHSDCVIITAYLLQEEAPALSDPPRQLFPEEFGEYEPPGSMQASAAKGRKSEAGGQKFTLQNIYFEGNSAVYTDESESTLTEVLHYVQQHPEYSILLIGHVNGRMGKRYLKLAARSNPERKAYKNAEHLSLARAESIRDYLVSEGIDSARIRCEGKGGKERLYKKPKNERQNEANRRIEIVLIP